MGFLGIDLKGILTNTAKKVLPAIAVGGSKADKAVLKSAVNATAFQPIFEKFGSFGENIAKTGLAFATAGIGSAAKSGGLLKNIVPAAKDIDFGSLIGKGFEWVQGKLSKGNAPGAGAPSAPAPSGGGFDLKSIPWWAWALVAVLLFGSQLKKLFK